VKKLLGLIIAFASAALPVICEGQDASAVALAQKEAVREFPPLGESGTIFNAKFLARVNSLRKGGDSVLLRDDWPLLIAKQVALEMGVDPVPDPTIAVAPVARSTPTPWVPHGTMLDQPGADTGDALPGTASAAPQATDDLLSGAEKKYYIYGTVIQWTADGLKIECVKPKSSGYESPRGFVWLIGKDVNLGDTVKVVAIKLDGKKDGLDEYKAE